MCDEAGMSYPCDTIIIDFKLFIDFRKCEYNISVSPS